MERLEEDMTSVLHYNIWLLFSSCGGSLLCVFGVE